MVRQAHHERGGRALGKVIMVQGTASSVGKSVLATALCRILRQEGYRVAPFKAQNMSLNAAVTPEGGEIGRAQAVQAEAAGVVPTVDMNPILLKPEADARSQVIVLGRPVGVESARDYYRHKTDLWPVVAAALDRLRAAYDIVVIEGAGSPAEINLRHSDIVNMRVARYAQAPVLLVGDIDRGGVFAALVGTMVLLEPEERALVRGLIINKFRGDPALLGDGLSFLEERTGVPVLGVVPYFRNIHVADEDGVVLEQTPARQSAPQSATLDVAVLRLPRIANFDDFDPLAQEPGVSVRYVDAVAALGRPDLVILPGSKSTVADLEFLRQQGLADAVCRLADSGTPIVGICGGFQMLGQRIRDPEHVESARDDVPGLGLLPAVTTFLREKRTCQVRARVAVGRGLLAGAEGLDVEGYEIHSGRTDVASADAPLWVTERLGQPVNDPDGMLSEDGLVLGTYLHGLFDRDDFRRAFLRGLARRKGLDLDLAPQPFSKDEEYDKLAAHMRAALDMRRLYEVCGLGR